MSGGLQTMVKPSAVAEVPVQKEIPESEPEKEEPAGNTTIHHQHVVYKNKDSTVCTPPQHIILFIYIQYNII